jgi:hypothetical protein
LTVGGWGDWELVDLEKAMVGVRTREKGMVVDWLRQFEMLSHKVGGTILTTTSRSSPGRLK